MQKLNFSIVINSPKEKVWNTMLDDKTYRIWTESFGEDCHYAGDWSKGSKILFLAPDENGKLGGMVSRIKENKLHQYISIEHLGVVQDSIEDTTSDAVKQWAGSLENYTFKDLEGNTELLVDMDINDEYKDMFNDMWPKALQKLKELAERK
ncbi:MAG: SRPBCC domain-containing protein [Ignavibacteriaceae bacterium]|nr:SRPBCC domain-containing protein [Ignavibacteriaceae bacterium]